MGLGKNTKRNLGGCEVVVQSLIQREGGGLERVFLHSVAVKHYTNRPMALILTWLTLSMSCLHAHSLSLKLGLFFLAYFIIDIN